MRHFLRGFISGVVAAWELDQKLALLTERLFPEATEEERLRAENRALRLQVGFHEDTIRNLLRSLESWKETAAHYAKAQYEAEFQAQDALEIAQRLEKELEDSQSLGERRKVRGKVVFFNLKTGWANAHGDDGNSYWFPTTAFFSGRQARHPRLDDQVDVTLKDNVVTKAYLVEEPKIHHEYLPPLTEAQKARAVVIRKFLDETLVVPDPDVR